MVGRTLEISESPSADECWGYLRSGLEEILASGVDPAADRWFDLRKRLKLGGVEVQMLALLMALELDQSLARAWRYAWADVMQVAPSWGFMTKLLSSRESFSSTAAALFPGRSVLFKSGLVSLEGERRGIPLSERRLSLAPEVLPVLLGWDFQKGSLKTFDEIGLPPARLSKSLRPRLQKLLRIGGPLRGVVHGPSGSGRLAILAQIAQGTGVREGLWVVDIGRGVTQERGRDLIMRARRMGALLDVAVVVKGLERLGEEERRWVETVEDAFEFSTLLWMLSAPPADYFEVNPNAVLGVSYPPKEERLEVWKEALSSKQLKPEMLAQLAGQYLLSEGQIEGVVFKALAQDEGPDPFEVLLEEAREASKLGLGRLATPETSKVSLDQLIVDEETETTLEEIICYTNHRNRLMIDWGFGEKFSYGLGVTCLFVGPPGTGKTYGAQAIATVLGLELYRVDLSQMVSKYVGQTEKHLSELFDIAEKGNVLLLFDEADSLFGKRTEVKSSVDRYANLEVNYLLQRIERFEGVTILTTNFESGIDDAFARRIRYKVSFDAPDEEARQRIWRTLLPKKVPLASDVDFDELAQRYELSGGHIKEVLLRAASIAMGTPEAVLTQSILLRSANVEYKKLNKLSTSKFPPKR